MKIEDMEIKAISQESGTKSNLQGAAIIGTKWSAASQLSRQMLQFVTTIILARLLLPADFGLMGMVMVVVGFIGLFKDLGTSAAVIQKKEISEVLLSSIFWVNAIFGLLAMAFLYILAPLIAAFYHETRLVPLLRFISFLFLVSGMSIVQQAILERELEFGKLARIEIFAVLTGAVVGVCSALNGFGVWSLAYQAVTTTSITTILLMVVSRWIPSRVFRWVEIKSVSGFSLNLTGFSILNYFVRNGDYILIGRILGAQQLGYYTLAYSIMFLPLQNISAVISRVMFPVCSQIQDNQDRFQQVYRKIIGAIALISFPVMMGLWALVKPFILFTFGAQWQPSIPLLIILVPVGIVQSLGTTVGIIYQARGRTDLMFKWILGAGPLIILSFFVGLRWGILGVASSYAVISLILAYPNFAIPFKLINLSMSDFWQSIWKPLQSSLVMLAALCILKTAMPDNMPAGMVLLLLVPIGALIYLSTSWFTNRAQLIDIWTAIKAKA